MVQSRERRGLTPVVFVFTVSFFTLNGASACLKSRYVSEEEVASCDSQRRSLALRHVRLPVRRSIYNIYILQRNASIMASKKSCSGFAS